MIGVFPNRTWIAVSISDGILINLVADEPVPNQVMSVALSFEKSGCYDSDSSSDYDSASAGHAIRSKFLYAAFSIIIALLLLLLILVIRMNYKNKFARFEEREKLIDNFHN